MEVTCYFQVSMLPGPLGFLLELACGKPQWCQYALSRMYVCVFVCNHWKQRESFDFQFKFILQGDCLTRNSGKSYEEAVLSP